jgi:glycerol kinase
MVHHASNLSSTRLEDTLIPGGPGLSLKVDALSMKPTAATPRRLPDLTADIHTSHVEHLPQGIIETDEEKKHHWFVGSIDQGTTSSRFLIFNGDGEPIASHQIEFENLYPKSGYVTLTSTPSPLCLHPNPGDRCGASALATPVLTTLIEDGTNTTR